MYPLSRQLTQGQLWLIFSALLCIHVMPLLLADLPYLDDYWRQQLAANDWVTLGRPLAAALFAGLGFGPGAPDLYPLPLLLAIVVTADGFARLVRFWFNVPDISALMVVLPLWFQPFFLQNLTYQYDSASMALSLTACVWALCLGVARARDWVLGTLLVVAGAGFYQVSFNVFAGLCAVELMRQVINGASLRQASSHAVKRLGQLIGGCVLYYLAGVWMIKDARNRQDILAFDGQWFTQIYQRLEGVAGSLGLLVTSRTEWMILSLLFVALLALRSELTRLWQRPFSRGQHICLSIALLVPIPLVVLSIPGFLLLLGVFEGGLRVYMGLGVLLVLLLFLVHRALASMPRVRLMVMALPLLFMLAFSFAYGRYLVLYKELQQAVTYSLAHDVSSTPELASAQHYYLLDYWLSNAWLPAARGTLKAFPAIENVFSFSYLLLPEMLPRVGLDDFHTFSERTPLDREQVIRTSPVPLVRSKYYHIHMVGDAAYILVKDPRRVESSKQ